MDAEELLAHIHEDHGRLRGKAEVLEALALRILRGDEDLGSALRLKGEEIQALLVRHMLWEERELLPALRSSGDGAVADRISAEHDAERERIADTLVKLQDSERRPVGVARHLVEFVKRLEKDMTDEEECLLGGNFGPGYAARSRSRRSDLERGGNAR